MNPSPDLTEYLLIAALVVILAVVLWPSFAIMGNETFLRTEVLR
jgi:hypothetical protein